MHLLTACALAYLVAADPDKVIQLNQFEVKKTEEMKVKVIKEEITVKSGEAFAVKLESNPTTGFSWRTLGPNYGPLELKRSQFEKAVPGGKPGAPGVQVFEFVARQKNQQIVLVFNYGRPFEGLGPQCYELKVKVAD